MLPSIQTAATQPNPTYVPFARVPSCRSLTTPFPAQSHSQDPLRHLHALLPQYVASCRFTSFPPYTDHSPSQRPQSDPRSSPTPSTPTSVLSSPLPSITSPTLHCRLSRTKSPSPRSNWFVGRGSSNGTRVRSRCFLVFCFCIDYTD